MLEVIYRQKWYSRSLLQGAARFVLALLILLIFFGTVSAGTLSDFEHELKKDEHKEHLEKKDSNDQNNNDSNESDDYDDTSIFGELFGQLFVILLVDGGTISWGRVAGEPVNGEGYGFEPRKTGEAVIPYARVDIGYQDVESDVTAMDYRAELGYGPIGIEGKFTRYKEDDPPDEFETIRIHGLYRMCFGRHMEIDLGMGTLLINGMDQDYTEFSVTLPVIVRPFDFLGVELRPSWATIDQNELQDTELSLLVGWKYLSLKAGYRWFRTGNASLDGPMVGIAAYW